MKLFKTTDEKIEALGFTKTEENQNVVRYIRVGKFTHVVDILHKANGNDIIQSFDKDLFDEKCVGNTCVGLTYKEAKLFLKKMKKHLR